jgi:multidrug efflux pump subunit AcrA (membrane-fusion protein)
VNVQAAAALRYANEQIYRAEGSGFLTEVRYRTGDRVEEGDRLLRLSNREVEAEVERLKLEMERQLIRTRWARVQQSPAEFEAERVRYEALNDRYTEESRYLESLSIDALKPGTVIAPGLAEREGQFIQEGERLLSTVDDEGLELVLAIPQENIDAFLAHLGGSVEVFITDSGLTTTGRLSRIDGRATQRIDTPELTQLGGGPLAVKASTHRSGENELVQPIFTGIVALSGNPAGQVFPGQRGYVRFETEAAELFAVYAFGSAWNLIERLLETSRNAAALNNF